MKLDETHDPARTSWVEGADGHADFPIQNLPYGVFSPNHCCAGSRQRLWISWSARSFSLRVRA